MHVLRRDVLRQVGGGDPGWQEVSGVTAAIGGGVGAAKIIGAAEGGLAAMGSGAIAAGAAYAGGLST